MQFSVPSYALSALGILEDAGHEAYFVGGCVRDILRGAAPHDYDMATAALPEEILAAFSGYRTIKTGIRHGTVTVLVDRMPIEITTYRTDGLYTDHRRPDSVAFSRNLKEDLARRDFTVNAMALHPIRGLVDPFGGQGDLAAGVIRAVGDPYLRFDEDALRILRALRFSARLGFSLDRETAAAARSRADTLVRIAKERIREELFGILLADKATSVLYEYADILSAVLPEGRATESLASLPASIVLRLAEYLFASGEKAAVAALARLRTDKATISRVETVIRLASSEIPPCRPALCRLLREVGESAVREAILLGSVHGMDGAAALDELDGILADGVPYTLRDLALSGDDVVAAGVERGPLVGRMLEALYGEVIEGRLANEPRALLERLRGMRETSKKGGV